MKGIAFICLALAISVSAHSWLGCSDYRGSPDYYEDSKCYAYPRNWATARSGALTQITNGYQLGADTGYNFQGTETKACQLPMTSPIDNAYTTAYPKAIYEQGQLYCLAWPTKNHVAATCTNQYIPDTSMKLKVSADKNPTSDPNQSGFIDITTTNFGTHTNGQIDCVGFQRSPKFCENTDKALATGCFKIPTTMATGTYVFQWYWIFNSGDSPYTTCYDAQVVASGSGRGAGGLTAGSGIDTIKQGGVTTTCSTNWATANSAASITSTTPSVATSTGTSTTPTTATGTATVPLSGDSIRITSAPSNIGTSGSFSVGIAWSVTGSRVITVDILDASNSNWYGKGTLTITATGSSSATITVTINTAQSYGAPVNGQSMLLRAWIVSKTVFDDYEAQMQLAVGLRDPVKSQPWTQEMDREEVTATVGTSSTSTGINASFMTASWSAHVIIIAATLLAIVRRML